MPENIPLDSEVEGTIVYPLSDETGIRIDGTLDTWLHQIYDALLNHGSDQVCEILLNNVDALTELKDAIDARLDDIRQAVDDGSTAVLTVNDTIDAKLGQVKESIDDNGAVAKVIDDTLNARLEDIYEALLDNGYELPTATDSLLGGVMVDLDTIMIRNGVISVVNPLLYMTNERVVELTPFEGDIPYVSDDITVKNGVLQMGSVACEVNDGRVDFQNRGRIVDGLYDITGTSEQIVTGD